jgi:hypothetical protein
MRKIVYCIAILLLLPQLIGGPRRAAFCRARTSATFEFEAEAFSPRLGFVPGPSGRAHVPIAHMVACFAIAALLAPPFAKAADETASQPPRQVEETTSFDEKGYPSPAELEQFLSRLIKKEHANASDLAADRQILATPIVYETPSDDPSTKQHGIFAAMRSRWSVVEVKGVQTLKLWLIVDPVHLQRILKAARTNSTDYKVLVLLLHKEAHTLMDLAAHPDYYIKLTNVARKLTPMIADPNADTTQRAAAAADFATPMVEGELAGYKAVLRNIKEMDISQQDLEAMIRQPTLDPWVRGILYRYWLLLNPLGLSPDLDHPRIDARMRLNIFATEFFRFNRVAATTLLRDSGIQSEDIQADPKTGQLILTREIENVLKTVLQDPNRLSKDLPEQTRREIGQRAYRIAA